MSNWVKGSIYKNTISLSTTEASGELNDAQCSALYAVELESRLSAATPVTVDAEQASSLPK